MERQVAEVDKEEIAEKLEDEEEQDEGHDDGDGWRR